MYCTKCGTQLPDDSKFCHNCGAVVRSSTHDDTLGPSVFDPVTPPAQQTYTPPPQPRSNTTGERNEGIFGLLGFILSFFVPIAGLILSIIGLKRNKNRGLAIAGLVISIVTMILSFIIWEFILSALGSYDDDYWYYAASMALQML